MPSPHKHPKQTLKTKQREKLAKKEAYRMFMKQFLPLIIAVGLWLITSAILHLPAFREQVQDFFVRFTLNSAVAFGKLLFIPVESLVYPNITVAGYTMEVIMECTAYNFYIFVIFLSLLSPVNWKQRLLTLAIFLAAIFVVNNFRFYTMGFIGKNYSHLFHNVHDYLWNILFGFFVFLIWLWRYREPGRAQRDSNKDEAGVQSV
jgi:exosortase/archaeosortase family protein